MTHLFECECYKLLLTYSMLWFIRFRGFYLWWTPVCDYCVYFHLFPELQMLEEKMGACSTKLLIIGLIIYRKYIKIQYLFYFLGDKTACTVADPPKHNVVI